MYQRIIMPVDVFEMELSDKAVRPGLPDGEILSPLLDKRTLVTTLNNAKG